MKYYREEYLRHPEAQLSILTPTEIKEAAQLLYRHFQLPELPIYFTGETRPGSTQVFRRLRQSYLSLMRCMGVERPQYIYISKRMMNAKTLAHEVAHYVRAFEDLHRLDPTAPRGRSHDTRHATIVDKAVKVLRANGYAHPECPVKKERAKSGYPTAGSTVKGFKMMADPAARAAFYASLDPVTTPPHIMAVAIASREY